MPQKYFHVYLSDRKIPQNLTKGSVMQTKIVRKISLKNDEGPKCSLDD